MSYLKVFCKYVSSKLGTTSYSRKGQQEYNITRIERENRLKIIAIHIMPVKQ
jgi:hypothetical protein